MTTTIAALPFMGGTLSSFDPSDTGVVESTSGGTYDPAWATCSLSVNYASIATSPKWPAAATFWARFFTQGGVSVSGVVTFTMVEFFHTGTVVARLVATEINISAGFSWNLYTLQGASMTLVGSFIRPWALNPFDINVVGNTASGSAALYSNNTLVFSASGLNHSAWAGVDQVKFYGPTAVNSPPISYFSEIICDTTSTVGRRLRYDRLNTNSATNTGWTGGVSNINEIPTNDATFISSGTATQISTFYENGLNLGSFNILARGVAARMWVEGAGPPKIQLAIRNGGNNYTSTAIAAATGAQAAFNSWTTDPSTGLAWTDSGAQSAESGVESST